MKYLLSTMLCLAVSLTSSAKDNPGADLLSLGELDLANNYFRMTMRQTPADSHYYLGELAFREGKIEEAKTNYKQGLDANPQSVLSAIGLAKVELKSNTKAAEDQLSTIQKENKKDIEIVLAIARAYADNGMVEKTQAKVADARKIDKKSPLLYLFEGELLERDKKMGEAAAQYDQAIAFDPKFVLAYVKGAKVYESINSNAAIGMLKKAIEIDPNYMIAYKYLGRIYSTTGFFPEGVEAYKKYFATGNYTVDDIKYYAGDEYYFKNYEKVKELSSEGLVRDANNFVLSRLLMYSTAELKQTDEAYAAAQKYFSIPRDKDVNYITQDYITYAQILNDKGQIQDAIAQYQKAVESDSSKIDLHKEIAAMYASEGLPTQAAESFKKYVALAGENAGGSDFFQLGRYYSTAASAAAKNEDAAVKATSVDLLKEADKAYAKVSELAPESYLGYCFRARTNASLDPETTQGLAKPHYEKMIEVITTKGDNENNKELIEANQYLAYYYYVKYTESKLNTDKEQIKFYSEKVLELDPQNSNAKQLLELSK